MTRPLAPRRGFAAAGLIATLGLAVGCGGNAGNEQNNTTGAQSPTAAATTAAEQPFGPGCSQIPATGPGSAASIADQPVATAASQVPMLSTLTTAVTKAGVAGTLNSAPALTVFAPTNDAFAKIPSATLNKVLADKKTLTGILTYHVVGARHAPADLDSGTFKTLQGGTITTAKSGDTYTVNGARVVCGNVQTRNATVYLIDTVLMPKS